MGFFGHAKHVICGYLVHLKENVGDFALDLLVAIPLTLVAILWRGAMIIRTNYGGMHLLDDFSLLRFLLYVLITGFVGAVSILIAGGAIWLVVQIIKVIAQWRAGEELREGLTTTQTTWIWVGVIFLGLPEFSHAISWWLEMLEHLIHYVPGGEEEINRVNSYYHALTEKISEYLEALIILGSVAVLLTWNIFASFRLRVRLFIQLMKTLLINRDWRFPGLMVVLLVVTCTLARNDTNLLFNDWHDPWVDLLTVEIILLLIWVPLPIIKGMCLYIAFMTAALFPGYMIGFDSGSEQWAYTITFATNLIWGCWLFSIVASFMRRSVYWIGVLGFLAYFVW